MDEFKKEIVNTLLKNRRKGRLWALLGILTHERPMDRYDNSSIKGMEQFDFLFTPEEVLTDIKTVLDIEPPFRDEVLEGRGGGIGTLGGAPSFLERAIQLGLVYCIEPYVRIYGFYFTYFMCLSYYIHPDSYNEHLDNEVYSKNESMKNNKIKNETEPNPFRLIYDTHHYKGMEEDEDFLNYTDSLGKDLKDSKAIS